MRWCIKLKKNKSYKTLNNGLTVGKYLYDLQQLLGQGWIEWAERGRRKVIRMQEKGILGKNFTIENHCLVQNIKWKVKFLKFCTSPLTLTVILFSNTKSHVVMGNVYLKTLLNISSGANLLVIFMISEEPWKVGAFI